MNAVAFVPRNAFWARLWSHSEQEAASTLQQKLDDALAKIAAIDRSNAVIEFSMDGTVLDANDNFLKTLGYSREEVLGKHHKMFVEADFAKSQEYQDFWKSLNDGQFYSARFKRIGKGGQEVFIQATYNPVIGANGRPAKVIKFATDITEEVRSQEEATRLMNMVENLPTNLIFADSNNIIRYMNPSSYESLRKIRHLLPVSVDDVVGKSIDIFHKNPEHQKRLLANPSNLPIKSQISLGDEILDLEIHAINDRKGVHMGVMATWNIVTEHAKIRQKVGDLGKVGQTVASNVQDMGAAISEISANISRTAGLAVAAEEQSNNAGKSIKLLGSCSGEIEDVVTLIQDLAEQTNLLALNATIEAARAGEAGRGFAVVASEVKTLATETRSATESIAERVARIRSSIDDVIVTTNQIANGVAEVSGNTTQVAAAIEEQSAIITMMTTTADDLVSLSTELQKL